MAGDVKAGGAYVELSLNSDRFKAQLSDAERRLTKIGASIAGIGAAFTAFGTAGIAAFIPAIKAASDAQEQMSKFETVFRDQSDAMKAFAATLASELGRSEGDIVNFLAQAQDLFVPLGFDRREASELSKTITRLSVDIASFNNQLDADVFNDLRSALTGSSEVMAKYGVNIKEAAIQQQLLNQNINPKTATEQEKVLARIAIILRDTSDAQGDAVRTSGSFANQLKRLQGQLADTAGAIGAALLPGLTRVLNVLNRGGTALKTFITDNQSLVRVVFLSAAGIATLGGVLVTIGVSISLLGVAIGGLLTPLTAISALFGGLLSVASLLLNPLGLLVAGIAAVGVAIVSKLGVAGQVVDFLRSKFGDLVADFRQAITAIGNLLAAGDIQAAGRVLWLTLQTIWQNGIAALNTEWVRWRSFFLKVWTEATQDMARVFVQGAAVLQSTWNNLTDYFVDAWSTVTTAIQTSWGSVQRFLAAGIIRLGGLIDSELDVEGAIAELDRTFGQQQQALLQQRDQGIIQRQRERDQQLDAIAARETGILESIEDERRRRLAEIDTQEQSSLESTQRELVAARKEWQDAIKAASSARDQRAAEGQGQENPLNQFLATLQQAGQGLQQASRVVTQSTLFGGNRAAQIFGTTDSVSKQQLEVQRQQLDEAKRTRQAVEKAGMVFG